ncbi:MAG: S-adenosyl-l-methionine hydroxide adenosyltransferase family protein [Cyclobacteriaceae bacterium]|nr:S-adenosyl-l-methionine hydroxide adenosyltransferase family protein [Cyclobacteriaceae bacterium]
MSRILFFILSIAWISCNKKTEPSALVFQSDFGIKDGAVAAMKGVAFDVCSEINMYDITHEIPAYDIWEAAYRLHQSAPYWPPGTVFVSVVDPGVGSDRKSVVLKTKSGHYFVSPDNGTLTLVAEYLEIEAVREIDEKRNRRVHSEQSYTFHGRDVYAYTGARLAAGSISFEQVGKVLENKVMAIPYQKATVDDGKLRGNIPALDVQYGNVWTNIDQALVHMAGIEKGDSLSVKIYHQQELIFEGRMPYVNTFSDVSIGENLAYANSLMNLSLGINQESFSSRYKVFSGASWHVEIQKIKTPK